MATASSRVVRPGYPLGDSDRLTVSTATATGTTTSITHEVSNAVLPTNTQHNSSDNHRDHEEEEEIIEEEIMEEVEVVDEEIIVDEEVYSEDDETMEETILDEKPLFITIEDCDDPQTGSSNSVRMTQAIILGRIHSYMKGPICIPWSDMFQHDSSSQLRLEWRQNLHTSIINGLLQSFPATTARRHVQHLVKSLPLKMTQNTDQQLRHCQPLRSPDDLQQFAETLLRSNNKNALCFVLDGKMLHTHPNWNRDTLDPDWVGISPFAGQQDDPIINTSGRQSITTMSTLSSYETLDDDNADDPLDDVDDDDDDNFANPHQSLFSTTRTFLEQDDAGVCLYVTDDTEPEVTERLLGAMQPALEYWFSCHETAFLEPNPWDSIITTSTTTTPMPQTPTVARIMTATAATPERSERSHKTTPPVVEEKQDDALVAEVKERRPEEGKGCGLQIGVIEGEEDKKGDGLFIGAVEGEEEEEEEGGGGGGLVIGSFEGEEKEEGGRDGLVVRAIEGEEETEEAEEEDYPLRWAVKAAMDIIYPYRYCVPNITNSLDLLTENGDSPREEEQRQSTVDYKDQSKIEKGSVWGETDMESDGLIRGDNSNIVTPPRSNLTKCGDSQGTQIPPSPSVQRESHAPTDEIGTRNVEMATTSQISEDQGTPEDSDRCEPEDETTSTGGPQSEGRSISEDSDRNESDKEETTSTQSTPLWELQEDLSDEQENIVPGATSRVPGKKLDYTTSPNVVDTSTDKGNNQAIGQRATKVYETRQKAYEGPSKRTPSGTTQEGWNKYSSRAVEEPFDIEAQHHTTQGQKPVAQSSSPDAHGREASPALQEYMMQKQKEEKRTKETIKTIRTVLLTLLVVLPFTLGLFFTLGHETTD